MNKKILLSIVAVLTVVIVVVLVGKSSPRVAPVKVTQSKTLYCGSDGQLVDVMPIQSHRSYCVSSNTGNKKFSANTPSVYTFSIIDDQGVVMKDFAITHTKPMHVIVARKDLKYFQHVHPLYDETSGKFSLTDLTFPADGEYRIFADFAAKGGMMDASGMPLAITVSEDVMVGNATSYTKEALGSEERTKTFSDLKAALIIKPTALVSGSETMLTYALTDASNTPIKDLETYLGALGHAVVLREGTLDFIHAHPLEDSTKPQNGKVNFMVYFPESGKYKIFTQFQRAGKVITTEFVVKVEEGKGASADNVLPQNNGAMMTH